VGDSVVSGNLPAGVQPVLSLLARKGDAGATQADIEAFFMRSLAVSTLPRSSERRCTGWR